MTRANSLLAMILVFIAGIVTKNIQACSMYKITVDGKTMVGCNEDAWRTTSKVWFETAKSANEYGAAFTGSRQVPGNRTAPQSGMNEMGLTFSRLGAFHPEQENPFKDRIKIKDEVSYLTEILHKCATIADVKDHINQYDHSLFYDHVFIYIDSTGRYLVVEPYRLIEGNDPNYVLSNFCPSITDNGGARMFDRYRNGEDFLRIHEAKSSLDYCAAVSDTMHVCRSRNGDGTLLTSIWDTKKLTVNLYFYHAFDSTVQFGLTEELAKGDHVLNVPELFPPNPEFERLASYKTPLNTPELRFTIVIIAGLLTLFTLILVIFKLRKRTISTKPLVLTSIINSILVAYMFVLATNLYIYYFDAPFEHYSSTLVSASSYIPFLLALAIVPITTHTIKVLRKQTHGSWFKVTLAANNLVYLMLIFGFGYWGLFSVWN